MDNQNELVIIYNPKQSNEVWQDEAQNEKYILEPGCYKIVRKEYANYFIGLDEDARKRVLFRRTRLPVIQACEVEKLSDLIADGMILCNNSKELSDDVSIETETEVLQDNDFTVIPIGRYKGKKWEEVLKGKDFDKSYWRRLLPKIATTKNISDEIKTTIAKFCNNVE